jgi:hypothetical protein
MFASLAGATAGAKEGPAGAIGPTVASGVVKDTKEPGPAGGLNPWAVG